ncbi:MAG: acyl-CoA thioesterase [Tannerella sp.]|jgi:acyl-CoA thioester hydrolase|nr:acyl-CoA thioesterase [Tannerella sp.]
MILYKKNIGTGYMLTYEMTIRVRYKETDAMGVVHHSNYATYYESARTEMLRSLGTSYRDIEHSGILMPVHEINMKFYKPAFYDDLLTVKLIVRRMPSVRMIFEHEIFNERGELVNTGTVVLTLLDVLTRKVCRPPKELTDLFAKYFEI